MGFKQFAFKAMHVCKAHAPEIMVGASIVAGAAALYFTAKGTTKLEGIIDEHKEKVDDIKAIRENVPDTEVADSEYKKELTKQYLSTAGKVALAYAPAATLAAASAVLSVSAHGIMKKRVATTLAALESVSGAFEAYRQRVKDKYGDEEERNILTGRHTEVVQVETTDKKGNTKLVDKKVENVSDIITSPYARYFRNDGNDAFWVTNDNNGSGRSYNQEFLESQEQIMGLKLRQQGFLFLNDVYRALGFEECPQGQLVGWLDNSENGDGYVSFNITKVFEGDNENDDVWYLDFNVDGVIFDKI